MIAGHAVQPSYRRAPQLHRGVCGGRRLVPLPRRLLPGHRLRPRDDRADDGSRGRRRARGGAYLGRCRRSPCGLPSRHLDGRAGLCGRRGRPGAGGWRGGHGHRARRRLDRVRRDRADARCPCAGDGRQRPEPIRRPAGLGIGVLHRRGGLHRRADSTRRLADAVRGVRGVAVVLAVVSLPLRGDGRPHAFLGSAASASCSATGLSRGSSRPCSWSGRRLRRSTGTSPSTSSTSAPRASWSVRPGPIGALVEVPIMRRLPMARNPCGQ